MLWFLNTFSYSFIKIFQHSGGDIWKGALAGGLAPFSNSYLIVRFLSWWQLLWYFRWHPQGLELTAFGMGSMVLVPFPSSTSWMVVRKVSSYCLQPLLICIAESWPGGAALLLVGTMHGAPSKMHIELYLGIDTILNCRKNCIPKIRVKSSKSTTKKFALPRQGPRCNSTPHTALLSGLTSNLLSWAIH